MVTSKELHYEHTIKQLVASDISRYWPVRIDIAEVHLPSSLTEQNGYHIVGYFRKSKFSQFLRICPRPYKFQSAKIWLDICVATPFKPTTTI